MPSPHAYKIFLKGRKPSQAVAGGERPLRIPLVFLHGHVCRIIERVMIVVVDVRV